MCSNLTDEKLQLIQLRAFVALSSDKQLEHVPIICTHSLHA